MKYLNLKKMLFVFSFILLSFFANAQDDLTLHNDFFINQYTTNFKVWFKTLNISESVLELDTISVKPQKLTLRMKMKDKKNWNNLTVHFESLFHEQFVDKLFNKLLFTMDLQKFRELVIIEIEGIDVFVFIKYKNDKIVAEIQKKMGEISDNINLEIGDIKYIPNSEKTISKKTMSKIQDILTIELKKYLITKKIETSWSSPVFETYSKYPNEFLIEVSNVTKMILPSNNYWERAVITFTFIQENDKMTIKYSILGKYASGPTWIPWKPFKTDYYDMEQKFGDELKKFSYKLNTKIKQLLTN